MILYSIILITVITGVIALLRYLKTMSYPSLCTCLISTALSLILLVIKLGAMSFVIFFAIGGIISWKKFKSSSFPQGGIVSMLCGFFVIIGITVQLMGGINYIVCMVALTIVCITSWHLFRTDRFPQGQIAVYVSGVLAIFTAFGGVIYEVGEFDKRATINHAVNMDEEFQHTVLESMGQYLGEHFPGKSILLIDISPSYPSDDVLKDKMESLNDASDNLIKISEFEKAEPAGAVGNGIMVHGAAKTESTKIVNQIINNNLNKQVILITCSVPFDLTSLDIWTKDEKKRPKFLCIGITPIRMKKAIQHRHIEAMIIQKPGALKNKQFESLDDAVFDNRFLLINYKNVDAVSTQFPKLF